MSWLSMVQTLTNERVTIEQVSVPVECSKPVQAHVGAAKGKKKASRSEIILASEFEAFEIECDAAIPQVDMLD